MWFWDAVSTTPFVLILVLGLIGRFDIVIGAFGVNMIEKIIKYVSRPYLADHTWLQRPSGACDCSWMNTGGNVAGRPGFPSGHAAIISFIVVAVILSYPKLKRDVAAWIIGVTIIILVDVSRIKRKCHTPLQVIAGTLLGITCAVLSQALQSMIEQRRGTSSTHHPLTKEMK